MIKKFCSNKHTCGCQANKRREVVNLISLLWGRRLLIVIASGHHFANGKNSNDVFAYATLLFPKGKPLALGSGEQFPDLSGLGGSER